MNGFSGISDTSQVEHHKMMKDKLMDGKNLGLEAKQSK